MCENDLLDIPSYGKPLGETILQGRMKLFCPRVHTALRMRRKNRHKKKQKKTNSGQAKACAAWAVAPALKVNEERHFY